MTVKSLIKKKNSSRGASILLALFILLVCVTVTTLIISAAGTSFGRVSGRVAEEQSYIAAQSAADIIASNYSGMELIAAKENGIWTVSDNVLSFIGGEYIKDSALSICSTGKAAGEVPLNLSFSSAKDVTHFTGSDADVSVSGTMKMAEDFSISCTITAVTGKSGNYTLSFTVPAAVMESELSPELSVKRVSWGEARIERGDR